ncbi:MAG: AAA family ATPase, partial [Geminicoccaceae bacterium]
VSSLDSDVLFIVSSLIKRIFAEIREKEGHIKQIFILTHNVYFHKEVSFDPKRHQQAARSDETFWIVRKADRVSKIERHRENPVSTSYELLWKDVKNSELLGQSIQNTLRRILEHYFKILGGMDYDEICELFDGNDKHICKSLFSWVHAGSHDVLDDLHVASNEITAAAYLRVFHEIFVKSRHECHYNMMMGINDLNEGEAAKAA